MELVVDANILVAGFLRAAVTRELLLDERLTPWTPEYAVLETERILLTPRIQRRFGKLSAEQVKLALAATTSSIQVLPESSLFQEWGILNRNLCPFLNRNQHRGDYLLREMMEGRLNNRNRWKSKTTPRLRRPPAEMEMENSSRREEGAGEPANNTSPEDEARRPSRANERAA